MADQSPLAFNLAEHATQIMREVCERTGLDPRGARLLRLRANAVFRLRSPIVVRIATSPSAAARRHFGLSQTDVNDFTAAYGHDLRRWPGYDTLMQIRDLYAIGVHIRNAPGDPFSRRELARRLRSLKNGTGLDRWHMKDPA